MNAVVRENLSDAQDVRGVLNYTRNSGVRPVNYTFDPPAGVARFSGDVDAREVLIRDARKVSGLGLEDSGFELIEHRGSLQSWDSFRREERVKAVDYPEVIAALQRHTGADKVVLFDHTLRDSSVEPGNPAMREAVRRVHDDQTLESAPRRVAKHLDAEEAAWRLTRRFAIVNFWRPVGTPVLRTPLAVCDARTIASDDLISSDLVYRDWTGETYSVGYNPEHYWYWYPQQQPHEATLLKIYDSALDGRARLTAHTAFELPWGADAPPRRSIEIRALLFW